MMKSSKAPLISPQICFVSVQVDKLWIVVHQWSLPLLLSVWLSPWTCRKMSWMHPSFVLYKYSTSVDSYLISKQSFVSYHIQSIYDNIQHCHVLKNIIKCHFKRSWDHLSDPFSSFSQYYIMENNHKWLVHGYHRSRGNLIFRMWHARVFVFYVEVCVSTLSISLDRWIARAFDKSPRQTYIGFSFGSIRSVSFPQRNETTQRSIRKLFITLRTELTIFTSSLLEHQTQL